MFQRYFLNHRVHTFFITIILLLSPLSLAVYASDFNHTDLIAQTIKLDSRIGATNLQVSQRGDKYIITGTVPSLLSKDLVEEVVKGVVGERYSVNGLIVNPPQVPDEEIRNAINVSVPSHCQMDIKDFKVAVQNGTVTLSGIGNSLHHRWLADYLARSTKGVRTVVNRIEIVGERKSDQWMRENILILLRSQLPEYSVKDLSVTVKDGRVTVGGSTSNYQDKKRVGEIVRNVNGVVSITNKIQLRSRTSVKYGL